MTATPRARRHAAPLLLLALAAGCAGGEAEAPPGGSGSSDAAAPSPRSDALLEVTLTRDDGTEAGPFVVPSGARAPSVTRIGDLTTVSAMLGDDGPVSIVTLKTRAPGPSTVRLDDQGETAEALRLLFTFRGEPGTGALEGQYESLEGEVVVTSLEDGRIAGTFDGIFERQHDESRHRVRGAFDLRRGS